MGPAAAARRPRFFLDPAAGRRLDLDLQHIRKAGGTSGRPAAGRRLDLDLQHIRKAGRHIRKACSRLEDMQQAENWTEKK